MTRTECEKLIIENLKMLHTMIKDYTGDQIVSLTISKTHVSAFSLDDDENYILEASDWFEGVTVDE
jgi:hypothetical protein